MGDLAELKDLLLMYQLKKSLVFQRLVAQGYAAEALKQLTLAQMRDLATESVEFPRDFGGQ